jgi:hypothetical protein
LSGKLGAERESRIALQTKLDTATKRLETFFHSGKAGAWACDCEGMAIVPR